MRTDYFALFIGSSRGEWVWPIMVDTAYSILCVLLLLRVLCVAFSFWFSICCSSGVGFRGEPDSSWLKLVPFRTFESLGALLNLFLLFSMCLLFWCSITWGQSSLWFFFRFNFINFMVLVVHHHLGQQSSLDLILLILWCLWCTITWNNKVPFDFFPLI